VLHAGNEGPGVTPGPRCLVPSLRRISPAGLSLSCRGAHLAPPGRALLSAELEHAGPRRPARSWRHGATPPKPRFAGAGGLAGSDLLPEFASLQVCPGTACGACPGFMKARYFRSTVATTTWPMTAPVGAAGEYEGFTQHAERPASTGSRDTRRTEVRSGFGHVARQTRSSIKAPQRSGSSRKGAWRPGMTSRRASGSSAQARWPISGLP
jgi:hypothetical protein